MSEPVVDARDVGSGVDVLVLGATGMLGSALVFELPGMTGLNVHGTVRSPRNAPSLLRDAVREDRLHELDVSVEKDVAELIETLRPEIVVNAIGMVKQAPGVHDTALTVRLNSLLPHLLSEHCERMGSRLIHVSTDCVFSGRRGGYREDDLPDPVDFYGRSKLAGEVGAPALTIRTSIVGPELTRHGSLLDWFLGQEGGTVNGFRGAIYSGVSTHEFARFLAEVVVPRPIGGLYQLAAQPISKYELLGLIARRYSWQGTIVPEDEFRCDRSLSNERLAQATGYTPPSWEQMVREMYEAHVRWHGPRPRKERA